MMRLFPFALLLAAAPVVRAADPTSDQLEFFEKKIRPVLTQSCYSCHSAEAKKLRGGLRVDSREALLKGGDNGPALVPGDAEKSRLIQAIVYKTVELQMPPKSKLAEVAIADLTAWVKMGAPWPRSDATTTKPKDAFDLAKRKREHWAWQPIKPVPPPAVKDQAWPRSPVDRFLLAALEAKGLTPAGPADKRTLLRRLSFDLIGLPPTPEQIEAFVNDQSPEAYEKVVDQLLASPHFGERWARHWMDLVRYGETRGHEFEPILPDAYQYRDYLVRAFNVDVPYNQFVLEHVAGDLLEKPRLNSSIDSNESILGTGFWYLGEEVHSPVDIRADQADRFDNRIDVLTKTFLGLTVSCARCHDHKFDAISSKDYYSLFSILESSHYRLVRFDGWQTNRRIARQWEELRQKRQPALRQALAEQLKPTVDRMGVYLLAGRAALQARPETQAGTRGATLVQSTAFTDAYRERVNAIAKAHNLDGRALADWTADLLNADKDPRHPLHVWARAALENAGTKDKPLADWLRPHAQAQQQRDADFLKGAEVIVDYSEGRPEDWLPDDVTFGPVPRRAGDIEPAGTIDKPQVRVVERTAAVYDRIWDGLKPAAGFQDEPGALGGRPRGGRTIRTPSFTINAGRLHYLVRGSGKIYAAVGQHVVIAGPLHGRLVLNLPAAEGYRWVTHDLTPYRGLRAHVEFTAAAGSDFAVAMVVQAERPPAGIDRPDRALWTAMTENAATPEAMAAGMQRLLTTALEKPSESAQLINWLIHHPAVADNAKVKQEASVWLAERTRLAATIRQESRMGLASLDGTPVDGQIFIRGSHKALGEPAPRRFLEALAGPNPLQVKKGSGRLELAQQMLDPSTNPFITRVIVNRLWHHLFGVGIVPSVDNFGKLGEAPSHPELLDYLADQFVKDGWSIKKTIRALVLTSAYRMSSQPDARAEQVDPQNRLLHRMRVRRLQGEAIRDSLLLISGRLDQAMGGPSTPIYLTPFLEGRGRPAGGPLDGNGRRSLYLAVTRNFLSPLMLAFDTPIPFSTVGRRTVSNVPAQALILLNDPFVHQQSELWARRVLAKAGSDEERIRGMYLSAFGRPPTSDELAFCLGFLKEQAKLQGGPISDPGPWIDLAHTLVNVKEFIFVH